MKPRFANHKCQALTLIEVLFILLAVALLAVVLLVMLLPIAASKKQIVDRINCAANLGQVSSAYQIWESDHNLSASKANDASGNLANAEKDWNSFLALAHAFNATNILHCPADTNADGKISYFFNLSGKEAHGQTALFGDDNFFVGDSTHPLQVYTDNAAGGMPVKSGLVEILSNTPIAWMYTRHVVIGNVAFTDGSVSETSNSQFQQAFQQSGLAANWLVIP